MTLLELAHKLRPIIEQAAQSLDEKTASTAPEIFPFYPIRRRSWSGLSAYWTAVSAVMRPAR